MVADVVSYVIAESRVGNQLSKIVVEVTTSWNKLLAYLLLHSALICT